MDLLKEQSKKLRAQINDSFEILVDKMKSIAELRYSPKSFRKQEQRIDDIANMYRDDGPYNDMGNDMVREWQKFTGARPKIISNVTPQPNLMSTPVRPKFVTRGVQTPPLTRTPDDSLDLDWDGGMDILKFQDGGLRVPQERGPPKLFSQLDSRSGFEWTGRIPDRQTGEAPIDLSDGAPQGASAAPPL